MGAIVRAFLLSSQRKYHKENLNFIIRTFLANDYPIKFIFNTINSKPKTLI